MTQGPGRVLAPTVFSDGAGTRPRASRPLARCGSYLPPHHRRVESMLGGGAAHRGPAISRHGACDSVRPDPGVRRAELPAGRCPREMRRARTCEPSLSKSTRNLTSTVRSPALPGAREQLASRRAARFRRPSESRPRRLLPDSCSPEPLLTLREPLPRVRLAAVARCRAPNPLHAEHA